MAKKFNFDFSRVKSFLLEKGERVALVVCGAIALLLIVFTFLGALSAGKPTKGNRPTWTAAFEDQTKALTTKIQNAMTGPAEDDASPKPAKTERNWKWEFVKAAEHPNPFFQLPDRVDTKRRRPAILLPREERVDTQFVQGGFHKYIVDPRRRQVAVFKTGNAAGPGPGGPGFFPGPMHMPMGAGGMAGAELMPVKSLQPVRMVVVSAVFPMKAQMEAYRIALRHPTVEDLIMKGDVPKAVGLIVYRSEKGADGNWTKAAPLYDANPKTGETRVGMKQTRELLQFGLFDRTEAHAYGPHVVGGMMTPLPKMANAEIPLAKLDGIETNDAWRKKDFLAAGDMNPGAPGPMAPMGGPAASGAPGVFPGVPGGMGPGGGEGAAGLEIIEVSLDKMPRQKDRFMGKLEPFPTREKLLGLAAAPGMGPDGAVMPGPAGMPPGAAGMPPGAIGMPPGAVDMGPGEPMGGPWIPGMPGSGGLGQLPPDDALIRFIDADVVPGKTYKYWVKVRFANPSEGPKFKKEVAFEQLTKEKELTSSHWWPMPGEVTIPGEFFYYVADETPRSDIRDGSDHPRRYPAKDDSIAMQLHRWIKDVPVDGRERSVGDWAIAERLVIRKGEFIGRPVVKVEMPLWEERRNTFQPTIVAGDVKKKAKGEAAGVPIDFSGDYSLSPSRPRKHALVDFEGGKLRGKAANGGTVIEDVAIRALVLDPDGKLTVRNSQDDMGSSQRTERVEGWRKRVEEANRAGSGSVPGADGAFPGVGGFPGVPGGSP